MTLRLKQETVERLEKESTRERLHLSAFANVIFDEYLEVHLPASKAGLVYTPKKLLRELVREVPDEKIPAIAAIAALPGLECVTWMTKNGSGPESMMQTLLALSKYSGYICTDSFEDGKRTISIIHHMGVKYGKLMQSFLEHIFADVKDSVILFETSDDRVTMTIERRANKPKTARNDEENKEDQSGQNLSDIVLNSR